MKRAALVILALIAIALPLRADFDAIVAAIESRGGLHRVRIPFLGLARFAVWVVHPRGVSDFQFATWEGAMAIDRRDIAAIVRSRVGRDFSPVVEATSARSGQWTFIYGRPRGNNTVELMIVTHDASDTVVVRAVVDAQTFTQDFDSPTRLSRLGRR
jgi:hypothetical protein